MRRAMAAVVAVVLALGLGAAVYGRQRIERTLAQAQDQVAAENRIAFDLLPLPKPPDVPVFQPVATPAGFVTGAVLHGEVWLGGPGGLAVYSGGAAAPRLLTPGVDLPPAPIVAIATGLLRGESQPEVIVATHGQGVLFFTQDGHASQLLPREQPARDITALLPLGSGDLLLGTRSRGVLLYRISSSAPQGSSINTADRSLQPFAPGLRDLDVTALSGTDGDLWIGTRNRGLLHWHAGQLDPFGADTGLPDPEVESLASSPGRAYAGTPMGVAEFRDGRLARVLAPGLFARALALTKDHLLVGTIDQGVQEIALATAATRPGARAILSPSLLQADAFMAEGDRVFAVARGAVYERGSQNNWTPVLSAPPGALTDRNIAALNIGPNGRLWVGFFNRGLDVWSPGSDHTEHIEDDHLFCIDRIVNDPLRRTVDVATANGLALFDPGAEPLRARSVLLRRDGLIADHVNDILFVGDTTVLATPAGLTFLSPRGAESLYAFQGLVNNHVYTLATDGVGDHVLAGTLGGVSLLKGEQIERNLTASNSGLKHNWITALLAMPADASSPRGAGYLVGTYGAGVMALDPSGHVSAMQGATSAAIINPNALLRTPTHVFAGTLSNGLLVYTIGSQRWSQITDGLPSLNVTSLAAANGTLYVGTDNGLVRTEESRLMP